MDKIRFPSDEQTDKLKVDFVKYCIANNIQPKQENNDTEENEDEDLVREVDEYTKIQHAYFCGVFSLLDEKTQNPNPYLAICLASGREVLSSADFYEIKRSIRLENKN